MSNIMTVVTDSKIRLDHYLASQYPDISRAFLQKLCSNDQILVNGQPEKSGFKLKDGDSLEILYDMAAIGQIESIDLPILYEDNDVIVINKPTGVISHARGRYWNEPSVASFIREKTRQTAERAGIVHRLDRATSGVMVCAKNDQAMAWLQKQFADRKVEKVYQAVVSGRPDPEIAVIDMPIERNPKAPSTFRVGVNGKSATTSYRVIQSGPRYALVELLPKTGRTHQLRVHLQKLGHPIVGDTLYGGEEAERLMLHARALTIVLLNGQSQTFESPLPPIFNDYMEK